MKLSKLRLITFDVTDTLLKFRSAPGRQYGEIGALYGVLGDNSALATNFKTNWHKLNKEHPNFGLRGNVGWQNWWKLLIGRTFKDSGVEVDDKKLAAISTHIIDLYRTSTVWQQAYGASDLLSYLTYKKVPLGVISNFDPRLSETLTNTKLLHYFDFILTSYEVGIEKPEKGIFDEAIKVSKIQNLKEEECLHIGDTPTLDYLGAKKAGWNAVLIHDRSAKQLKEKYQDVDEKDVFPSLYHLHKYFVDANGDKLIKEETKF